MAIAIKTAQLPISFARLDKGCSSGPIRSIHASIAEFKISTIKRKIWATAMMATQFQDSGSSDAIKIAMGTSHTF